jgi:hypothetical protein
MKMLHDAETLKSQGKGLLIMIITIFVTLSIMDTVTGNYSVLYQVAAFAGTVLKYPAYVVGAIALYLAFMLFLAANIEKMPRWLLRK